MCKSLAFLRVFLLCFELSPQFASVTQLCPTLCNPMDCSSPGFPVHHLLPELAQTCVHQVGDSMQPSQPLLSPSPPAFIFPSIRVFSNESVLSIRWPKYWSFSISPSNEYSALISSRMDWFDLFAVQGTLKSLLQNHSSKASILQHSALFMVQLSHLHLSSLQLDLLLAISHYSNSTLLIPPATSWLYKALYFPKPLIFTWKMTLAIR